MKPAVRWRGLAELQKVLLVYSASGQLGHVPGHCDIHALYILQQTMVLPSHCWKRCRHLVQQLVDCGLVVGAKSAVRQITNATITSTR